MPLAVHALGRHVAHVGVARGRWAAWKTVVRDRGRVARGACIASGWVLPAAYTLGLHVAQVGTGNTRLMHR